MYEELLDYVNDNPNLIANPNYADVVIGFIETILPRYPNINEFPIQEWLSLLFPIPRHLGFTIDKCLYSRDIKHIVNNLLLTKNNNQGTQEWHNIRGTMLTASNAYKALGSQCSKNSLIYEKCVITPPTYTGQCASFEWGHKYEPASVALYEYLFNTEISHLGCIPHNKYSFIGASPDGINTDPNSNMFGRLIEIKNVVSREITGHPLIEYWVQMQIQMEVCDLDFCDFIETKYYEYQTFNDFLVDTENDEDDIMTSVEGSLKGVIISLRDGYRAMPIMHINKKDWYNYHNLLIENLGNDWITTIYYRLDDWSCVLVPRNEQWFNNAAVPALTDIWNIIQKEKNDGSFTLRAPKKRELKNPPKIKKLTADINECLIDFNY